MNREILKKKYGIDELDGDVTINVWSDDKTATLTSTIINKGIEYIDVTPFSYKGKILSFQGEGLKIKLEAIMYSMRIEFGVQSISLVRSEDGTFAHRIVSSERNKLKNLREFKRFSLGEEGVVLIGTSPQPLECIVKDISYGGFGVAVKGKPFIPVKELLNLRFDCQIGACPFSIRTKGMIARTEYNDDRDETVIGVKLLVRNATVQEAVNQIQRLELQRLKHG